MLSKTTVTPLSATEKPCHDAVVLAPLAVALEHRDKGVGTQLIQKSMQVARQMEIKAVFLAGDPAYYTRFGFVPTRHYGIRCTMDVPDDMLDCIMVCELFPHALDGITGIVDYSL